MSIVFYFKILTSKSVKKSKCEIGKQLSQILRTLRTLPALHPGNKNKVSLDVTEGEREK